MPCGGKRKNASFFFRKKLFERSEISSECTARTGKSWKVPFGGLIDPTSTTNHPSLRPRACRAKENEQKNQKSLVFLRLRKKWRPSQRSTMKEAGAGPDTWGVWWGNNSRDTAYVISVCTRQLRSVDICKGRGETFDRYSR